MGSRLTTLLRVQLHRFRGVHCLLPLLRTGWPWEVQWCRPVEASPATLHCDGLRLAASYYRGASRRTGGDDEGDGGPLQASAEPQPGLVLTHGASPHGRRLALTQVLATLFQQRGYHVLTYDARCYGESDHPAEATDQARFNFANDVSAAMDWLTERPEVDRRRLFVVGHSFGAGTALAAEARDPRVARLVLFGPPRRLRERVLNPDAPDHDLILSRMQRDMNVPYPLDRDVVRQQVEKRDIEGYVARYQKARHTPLLLIDAEREHPADLAFLREVRARMSPRVRHWTAPRTDHYLNTGHLLGRVVYHPALVLPFVETVDRFLRDPLPGEEAGLGA